MLMDQIAELSIPKMISLTYSFLCSAILLHVRMKREGKEDVQEKRGWKEYKQP